MWIFGTQNQIARFATAQVVSVADVLVVVVMSIIEQSTNKQMRILFFAFANKIERLYVIIAQYKM